VHHSDDRPPGLPPDPRLLPGVPVLRRDADHLQVGLAEPCVVLPDRPEVRALLDRLSGLTGPTGTAGTDPVRSPDVSPATLLALARLARAGLLVDREVVARCLATYADGPAQRAAALASLHASPRSADRQWADRVRLRVRLEGAPADRQALERVLAAGGVGTVLGDADLVVLLVDGEPDREHLDTLQQADVAHLLVRSVLAEVEVGPLVVPGRTACVRCLDAHRTDVDPRWPLLLAQGGGGVHGGRAGHAAPPVRDPALWQLALGWAARDVLRHADGEQPSTWSATVRVGPDLEPVRRSWLRHPRCGCGWADLHGPGAHQYSESSLPSIERRCSREQVSQ
jgi:hypothetical protein